MKKGSGIRLLSMLILVAGVVFALSQIDLIRIKFSSPQMTSTDAPETEAVISHYADIAHATYSDALQAAVDLQVSIGQLVSEPSLQAHNQAKEAWISAREFYQQSEVFRFGNPVVDDWQGQMNGWPIDEGLIDYVEKDEYEYEMGNPGATADIIGNEKLVLGNDELDLANLEPDLLAGINELGGSEANVATGYHAIEFLLWGQDLNGTGPGAGNRSWTDYAKGEDCTHGHCARRGQYLQTVAKLLITDLEYMVGQWTPEKSDNYRSTLLSESSEKALMRIFFGMGSLALGELAGERMMVALEVNSSEEDHDCFSDNTHNAHYFNALGIRNVYSGVYRKRDGSVLQGASVADLVAAKDSDIAAQVVARLEQTEQAMQRLVEAAESGMAFDQLTAQDNPAGRQLIQSIIDALTAETEAIERAAAAVGIKNSHPDNADRNSE